MTSIPTFKEEVLKRHELLNWKTFWEMAHVQAHDSNRKKKSATYSPWLTAHDLQKNSRNGKKVHEIIGILNVSVHFHCLSSSYLSLWFTAHSEHASQLYLYVSSDLPGSLSHSVRVKIQNRQALSQRLPHRLTQLVQNKKGDKSFV